MCEISVNYTLRKYISKNIKDNSKYRRVISLSTYLSRKIYVISGITRKREQSCDFLSNDIRAEIKHD